MKRKGLSPWAVKLNVLQRSCSALRRTHFLVLIKKSLICIQSAIVHGPRDTRRPIMTLFRLYKTKYIFIASLPTFIVVCLFSYDECLISIVGYLR